MEFLRRMKKCGLEAGRGEGKDSKLSSCKKLVCGVCTPQDAGNIPWATALLHTWAVN
jgi:hypothetical protein